MSDEKTLATRFAELAALIGNRQDVQSKLFELYEYVSRPQVIADKTFSGWSEEEAIDRGSPLTLDGFTFRNGMRNALIIYARGYGQQTHYSNRMREDHYTFGDGNLVLGRLGVVKMFREKTGYGLKEAIAVIDDKPNMECIKHLPLTGIV